MAEQKSFKERVKDTVIQNANSYKRYFVDYEYLLCSEAFVNNEYYIVSAYEDNYLHLTGLHTSLDAATDLDADNIAHRVDYGSGVTAMEAFDNYYDDMNNSNDADAFRGNEFLQNNSYEDVEDVILNNLGCFTYEDSKNNSNYADALRFLERLKALQ